MSDFWAGYLSGAAGIVIGNPLDLVKVRVQAGHDVAAVQLNGVGGAAAPSAPAGWTLESTRTLVRGLPAPIITYGALNALLFATYNRSLGALSRYGSPDNAGPRSSSADARLGHTEPWQHFAAGFAAGLATFVISAPTEVIKCRAQVARDGAPTLSNGPGVADAAKVTSWKVVTQTYKRSGLAGFYQGGVITSLRDAVGYGFYFWTYEVCTTAWEGWRGGAGATSPAGENVAGQAQTGFFGEDALKILVCGGLAGIATWTSIFPLDVVKTRVQTQAMRHVHDEVGPPREYAGAWATAKHAYRTEGIGVFFRGLGVCNLRGFIVNAVQWAVYEWMMTASHK